MDSGYSDIIRFEWDENKNKINLQKHKVTFEEAKTIFYDENALLIDDPDHSLYEDRFILLGVSVKARVLMVCHCYRASDAIIRIISARKASKKEEDEYFKRLR